MSKTTIPYSQTRFFSNLMLDYLENKEHLKPFFNRFPEIENFEKQAKEKTQNYPLKNRKALVKALEEQYNLNQPIWQQYVSYLGDVVRGDFGPSFKYSGRTVMS